MALTRDEFKRFLEGTNKGHKCLHCGTETWAVNLAAGEGADPAVIKLTPEGGGGYHGFYSASCSTCGRTDFYHTNQISNWFAQNPPD